jgi:hypothetical protein
MGRLFSNLYSPTAGLGAELRRGGIVRSRVDEDDVEVGVREAEAHARRLQREERAEDAVHAELRPQRRGLAHLGWHGKLGLAHLSRRYFAVSTPIIEDSSIQQPASSNQ